MADAPIVLPDPRTAPRCSPWTREQGFAPAGTAIRADRVLLLDVPQPWPKPVKSHPRLVGLMDVVGEAVPAARLFATVPVDDRIRLTVFVNREGLGERTTYVVGSLAAIPSAVAAAAVGGETADMTMIEPPGVRPSLLVCTQGSHDVCCGSDGVRLASDVETRLAGLDVYRISHTGGHRFAPTAMTMPDGRMWAWLTIDDVSRLVDRDGDHADLARRCRGWWGADPGAAQAAEVAVFGQRGWSARPLSVHGAADSFEVVLPEETVTVRVEARREVPTIACRSAGGLPTKTATEYVAAVV